MDNYGHEDPRDSEPFLNDNLSALHEHKVSESRTRLTVAACKTVAFTLGAHLVPGALVTLLVLSLLSKSPLGSGDDVNGIIPSSEY